MDCSRGRGQVWEGRAARGSNSCSRRHPRSQTPGNPRPARQAQPLPCTALTACLHALGSVSESLDPSRDAMAVHQLIDVGAREPQALSYDCHTVATGQQFLDLDHAVV